MRFARVDFLNRYLARTRQKAGPFVRYSVDNYATDLGQGGTTFAWSPNHTVDLTEDFTTWSPAVCGGTMDVFVEAVRFEDGGDTL